MLSGTVVCKGTLPVAMFIVLTACVADPTGTQDGQLQSTGGTNAAESNAQSVAAECCKKLGALREDILRETCKIIENHIAVMEARLQILWGKKRGHSTFSSGVRPWA
jgi:hypothetical protein